MIIARLTLYCTLYERPNVPCRKKLPLPAEIESAGCMNYVASLDVHSLILTFSNLTEFKNTSTSGPR
jgi:hypothetical protein